MLQKEAQLLLIVTVFFKPRFQAVGAKPQAELDVTWCDHGDRWSSVFLEH